MPVKDVAKGGLFQFYTLLFTTFRTLDKVRLGSPIGCKGFYDFHINMDCKTGKQQAAGREEGRKGGSLTSNRLGDSGCFSP